MLQVWTTSSLIDTGLGMTVGVLEDAGAHGAGVRDAAGRPNMAGQLSSVKEELEMQLLF